MEENPPKLHTKIEINSTHRTFDLDLTETHQEHKSPFFSSRSRRRKTDTWVISVFVIVHLLIFMITMIVNDCGQHSHGHCAASALGRVSFQPLSENPLLGPSASTLDNMGALRKTLLAQQTWRLLSCPWLHAGVFHFMINLIFIVFIGFYLEKEFGSLRIGIIYILSAFFGTLVSALFVRDSTVVGSSGALFGLLGATLSALIRNWKFYSNKVSALLILFFSTACNFMLGLLPYIDNYSNIGGLISGFLLGFVLLFTPQLRQVAQNKSALYDHDVKSSFNWKQKLDRPVLASISLLLFSLLIAGFLVMVLQGINIGQYCKWCGYIDCIPFERWSCNDVTTACETMESETELTLTCIGNGNFRVFPFTNISQARTMDLCTLICP